MKYIKPAINDVEIDARDLEEIEAMFSNNVRQFAADKRSLRIDDEEESE